MHDFDSVAQYIVYVRVNSLGVARRYLCFFVSVVVRMESDVAFFNFVRISVACIFLLYILFRKASLSLGIPSSPVCSFCNVKLGQDISLQYDG